MTTPNSKVHARLNRSLVNKNELLTIRRAVIITRNYTKIIYMHIHIYIYIYACNMYIHYCTDLR